MTTEEAAHILKAMRAGAKRGQLNVQAFLFGLKYASDIEGLDYREISRLAYTGKDNLRDRIRIGVQLAELLNLKK